MIFNLPHSRLTCRQEHPDGYRCERGCWRAARGSDVRRPKRVLRNERTAWTLRMSSGCFWWSICCADCSIPTFYPGSKLPQPKASKMQQTRKKKNKNHTQNNEICFFGVLIEFCTLKAIILWVCVCWSCGGANWDAYCLLQSAFILAMFAEGKRTLRMRQNAIPTAELLPAALPELTHARDFCNCCRQPRERFQMIRPLVRDKNSPSLSSILLLTHTL